jgi:hypothetical protein
MYNYQNMSVEAYNYQQIDTRNNLYPQLAPTPQNLAYTAPQYF